VAVYDIVTGKPRLEVPTFQYLAGSGEFPLWFVREANSLLRSPERYGVCAGIGLIARLAFCLVPPGSGFKQSMCLQRCFDFTKKHDTDYKQSVVDAYNYEVDELIDGFAVVCKLHERGTHSVHKLIRVLKQRRDDLESVVFACGFVTNYMQTTVGMSGVERVDAVARAYCDKLEDDNRYCSVVEPRLNLIYKHNPPRAWWGVKGVL
jgi:hypothetical protein